MQGLLEEKQQQQKADKSQKVVSISSYLHKNEQNYCLPNCVAQKSIVSFFFFFLLMVRPNLKITFEI